MQQPQSRPRRSGPGWRWGVGVLVLVLFAAVTTVGVIWGDRVESPLAGDPITTSNVPIETSEPFTVEDEAQLTVPDTIRMDGSSFTVRGGSTYLMRLEVSTLKPEGSPGAAMYFGIALSCSGADAVESRSAGGTQNILTGEPVTLRQQFLLHASHDGERICRVSLNSPNKNAAAVGATVEVEVTWSAELVGAATEVPAEERLPLVVEPGERAVAFRSTMDLPNARDEWVEVITTLHLTTCTIVNGSREGGAPMCLESETDERGSEVDVELRASILDASGERCDSIGKLTESTHVDRLTHHLLLNIGKRAGVPVEACGNTVEFTVVVSNDGPAPLVVHGMSSTFVVVIE